MYAFVSPDNSYCIGIVSHKDWNRQEVLEIIEENWPELLDPFILKGVLDISHQPSDEERKKFRKRGINAFYKLKSGRILAPLGLGQTTARTSSFETLLVISFTRLIKRLEKEISERMKTEIQSGKLLVRLTLMTSFLVEMIKCWYHFTLKKALRLSYHFSKIDPDTFNF
ncbi:hypothetical protein FAI40_02990 [Acetobacteraceae bacterium]|nr:hypothetical protein FAI40_02990 [Acetobacteraceae bacterium]